ncbi:carbonate dehydratase [Haliangium ochraceum]|uniref:Carbonic anhydrase n=1 Tax=Haliangium ochraceum (strain DSM 14365 / JCM 11303 / SMP-2) TaxID=502025 RepID=D0LGZ4_HALO1|nr:carbonate dehydratase [Haliangium ochraceum]ACY14716.1 Carbonate dehydratase [Haliangium ochraceum DSM 14365]
MRSLKELFDNNQRWAQGLSNEDPTFFPRLAEQQVPQYLWIGCADSRVPANVIVGMRPGEIFVHRNVANLVVHADINCLSVVQYAVEVLKVRHIIVAGHYGCGGVNAAIDNQRHGLVDSWIEPVRTLSRVHREELDALDESERFSRLCELNVIAQVANLAETMIVRDAWERDQPLDLHGWIYAIRDGLLRDLDVTCSGPPR